MEWFAWLTHWGWVTHICASKLTIIGSDNGSAPGRRQAIIWTNAGILLIGPFGTNSSEIFIEIYIFPFKKMHLKMSSGNCRPFSLGLNVLNVSHQTNLTNLIKILSHISHYTIQNGNMYIFVLNGALWNMGQVHCVIYGIGLFTRSSYVNQWLRYVLMTTHLTIGREGVRKIHYNDVMTS